MMKRKSPTVRRRRLGIELRRKREESRMTCAQVGKEIECSASKISRMESAQTPIRNVDIKALCEVYGTDKAFEKVMLQLNKESKQTGWWQRYDNAVPDWFEFYVGLEGEADRIQNYEIQLVPGLLQTDYYARSVLTAGLDIGDGDLEQRIQLRMERQRILEGDDPTRLWVIMSEAVLQRQVGSRGIMKDQLIHLREAAHRPNITIQIIPNNYGAHPGMTTPFGLLGFDEDEDMALAYIDYLGGSLYLDEPAEIARFTAVYDQLRAEGLPPDKSVELIKHHLKEL